MKGKQVQRALHVLVMVGLAILLLIGCSNTANNSQPAATPNQGGTDSGAGAANAGNGGSDSSAEDQKYGGVLRIAVNKDIINIGYAPEITSIGDGMAVSGVMERLLRFDENFNLVPHLAADWETDPENRHITFHLRPGVKFHDGSDFNAEAVKWNIEHYMLLKRPQVAQVESVEVLDDLTVRLHLTEWNNNVIEQVGNNMVFGSMEAYEQHGLDWVREHPVGTGPFRFKHWEKGSHVVLERFDQYWMEGRPYLDGLEVYTILDPMTARAALQTGEVDVLFNADADTAVALARDYNVVSGSSNGAVGIYLSPDSLNPDSPFADARVRRAVGHAIDRDTLVKTILLGYGIATDQFSAPGTSMYNDEVEGTPYNPEKARQLLAEAGYPDGFRTKITFTNTPTDMQLYTAIQAYLKEVGIQAELNPVTQALYQEMRSPSGKWEGLLASTAKIDTDILFNVVRNMSSKRALYFWVDFPEELEAIIEEAYKLPTIEERNKIVADIQGRIFGEHVSVIPLYISSAPTVLRNDLKDAGFNQGHATQWDPYHAWIQK